MQEGLLQGAQVSPGPLPIVLWPTQPDVQFSEMFNCPEMKLCGCPGTLGATRTTAVMMKALHLHGNQTLWINPVADMLNPTW